MRATKRRIGTASLSLVGLGVLAFGAAPAAQATVPGVAATVNAFCSYGQASVSIDVMNTSGTAQTVDVVKTATDPTLNDAFSIAVDTGTSKTDTGLGAGTYTVKVAGQNVVDPFVLQDSCAASNSAVIVTAGLGPAPTTTTSPSTSPTTGSSTPTDTPTSTTPTQEPTATPTGSPTDSPTTSPSQEPTPEETVTAPTDEAPVVIDDLTGISSLPGCASVSKWQTGWAPGFEDEEFDSSKYSVIYNADYSAADLSYSFDANRDGAPDALFFATITEGMAESDYTYRVDLDTDFNGSYDLRYTYPADSCGPIDQVVGGSAVVNNDTRTCENFATQQNAQAAYLAGNKRLDGDGDGVACEGLAGTKTVSNVLPVAKTDFSEHTTNNSWLYAAVGGGMIMMAGAGGAVAVARSRRR